MRNRDSEGVHGPSVPEQRSGPASRHRAPDGVPSEVGSAVDRTRIGNVLDRAAFSTALKQALDRRAATETSTLLAVYFLGFDRADVSDGDASLAQVLRRLAPTVRSTDLVARLRADEFAVVVPDLTDEAHAQAIGATMLAALRQPADAADVAGTWSVAIGYALAPHDADQAARLMRRADLAMFESRQSGEWQPVRYDPEDWPIEHETAMGPLP